MSQLKDDLNAVATLLGRGWCQGQPAQSSNGQGCTPASPSAAAWCLLGAIRRVSGVEGTRTTHSAWMRDAQIQRAIRLAMRDGKRLGDFIPTWNDRPRRTQAQVVGLVRRAAEQAE